MVEISRPWDGTSIGDAGPYSAADWQEVWLAFFAPERATEGVFNGQLAGLAVTGAVSPVTVDTGRAMVDGVWYETDATTPFVVVTAGPALSRIDRVILRKDPTAQTVRLFLLAGADAASPTAPVLTQTPGGTWEISLFQVLIDDGGAITLTDERDFIAPQHAIRHAENATDEVFVEDLGTGSAVAGQVPTADGAGGLDMTTPAGGGGGLTREGGNTVEATTTSTVAVDLLSVSGLSIPASTPILIIGRYRKTSGAADDAHFGLKLNSTVVAEAVQSSQSRLGQSSTTNQAEDGAFQVLIPGRVVNYPKGSIVLSTGTIFPTAVAVGGTAHIDADLPSVTITDIIIRAQTDNALNTIGVDELQIYSLATS